MKIRIIRCTQINGNVLEAGQEYDLPVESAKFLIQKGKAAKVLTTVQVAEPADLGGEDHVPLADLERDELEDMAEKLGLTVNARWKDDTLRDKIREAQAAGVGGAE